MFKNTIYFLFKISKLLYVFTFYLLISVSISYEDNFRLKVIVIIFLTIKSVHWAGHIDKKSQPFRLFLRSSRFWILFAAFFVNRFLAGDALDQLSIVQLALNGDCKGNVNNEMCFWNIFLYCGFGPKNYSIINYLISIKCFFLSKYINMEIRFEFQ